MNPVSRAALLPPKAPAAAAAPTLAPPAAAAPRDRFVAARPPVPALEVVRRGARDAALWTGFGGAQFGLTLCLTGAGGALLAPAVIPIVGPAIAYTGVVTSLLGAAFFAWQGLRARLALFDAHERDGQGAGRHGRLRLSTALGATLGMQLGGTAVAAGSLAWLIGALAPGPAKVLVLAGAATSGLAILTGMAMRWLGRGS